MKHGTRAFLDRAIGVALLSIIVGCVIIPHPDIPLSDVPSAISASANITVIRKKQFTGSFLTMFISVDGVTIARLEAGEYTTFQVSEGSHSVGQMHYLPGFTPFPYVFFPVVIFFDGTRQTVIAVDCETGKNYFVTSTAYVPPDIWSRAGKALQGDRHADDRVQLILEQIERPEGEFALEHYRYVPPGPPKQK